jgi:eukaryotic-like serine/threonine-protein kinase
MQENRRCTKCDQLTVSGGESCEAHQESCNPTGLIMSSGAPQQSPAHSTLESPHTADNYAPVMRPNSKPEIFGRGAQLGEYIIEEKIGEGGMGEVWSARQPTINKRVAVKLLNLRVKSDPIQLARFKREALVVNQVKHRHLVDIFSFGELPDNRPYFVMELLDGETLSAFLKQRGTLPFYMIDLLFSQLCRALQAAHDHGVVHRDLKPDNIFMLSGDDEIFAKILDFGIAKLEETEDDLTKTGTRFGTPTYMSPEQCRESKNVSARSDIYALGIILYELLCGKTPFYQKGDPAVRVMLRHQSELPTPPSTVVPQRNIPKALDAIVLQALDKEEAKRPQSCAAFYAALKKALPKSEDVTVALPKAPKQATVVAPRRSPAQTRLVAAIVIGAAILGVSAAALLAKSGKQAGKNQTTLATPSKIAAVSQSSSAPASLVIEVSASAPVSLPATAPIEKNAKNKNKSKLAKKEKQPAIPTEKPKTPAKADVFKGNMDATLKPKFVVPK